LRRRRFDNGCRPSNARRIAHRRAAELHNAQRSHQASLTAVFLARLRHLRANISELGPLRSFLNPYSSSLSRALYSPADEVGAMRLRGCRFYNHRGGGAREFVGAGYQSRTQVTVPLSATIIVLIGLDSAKPGLARPGRRMRSPSREMCGTF
jgi:hypothetical protein